MSLLGGIFLTLNLLFLAEAPVRLGADSSDYTANAERLLRGQDLSEHRRAYLGYVLLLALAQYSGVGPGGVVAFQIAVAAVAAVALFDLTRELGGDWAGVVAAGLLVANPDIVRWHSYLLTDSLYISAVILGVWGIHSAARRKDLRSYAAAAGAVLAAALVRPNGWVLLPIAACYWINRSTAPRRAVGLAAGVVAVFAGLVIALLTLRPGLSTDPLALRLRQGQVVWGFRDWRQEMPKDGAGEGSGLAGVLTYAARHPAPTARLSALRVLAELAHTRPFYSARHNVLIVLFLPPVYLSAVVGAAGLRRHPLTRLLVAVVVAHLAVVGLTWADWDGRFLLYVLPCIGAFSACGMVRLGNALCERIRPRVSRRPS